MTTAMLQSSADQPATTVTRLLVTVRDAATSSYRPVGFLSHSDEVYIFAYLRCEVGRADFRPLPGLARAVARPMRSTSLFPLFAERVISARRPDRHTSLGALGLRDDAGPFEVLVRSHGHRVGDTIELLPAPVVPAGGPVSFTFLAHGVRHLPESSQERIAHLVVGEPLQLRPDPSNPFNPRAQLVTDADHLRLGWMPDPLLHVADALHDLRLTVERSNGPSVGYHFRLLVRVRGVQSADRDAFDGPAWATVSGDD